MGERGIRAVLGALATGLVLVLAVATVALVAATTLREAHEIQARAEGAGDRVEVRAPPSRTCALTLETTGETPRSVAAGFAPDGRTVTFRVPFTTGHRAYRLSCTGAGPSTSIRSTPLGE